MENVPSLIKVYAQGNVLSRQVFPTEIIKYKETDLERVDATPAVNNYNRKKKKKSLPPASNFGHLLFPQF